MNDASENANRRAWLIIAAAVAVLLSGILLYRVVQNFNARLFEHKTGRDAIGVVMFKKHVKYDEANKYYVGDYGQHIERQPGFEEWLVYYQITDFEEIDGQYRNNLMEAEKNRIANGKTRSWSVAKTEFEQIKEGDQINIIWRWLGDSDVEILNVHKP